MMSILAIPRRVNITRMATKFERFTNTFIFTATEQSLVKRAYIKLSINSVESEPDLTRNRINTHQMDILL